MKKITTFFLIFLVTFVTGCNSKSSKLDTYTDDFVEFEYNPTVITNVVLDAENGMDYFLVSKLLDDTITNPTSLLNLTGTAIIVTDTDKSLYRLYQTNYKQAFSIFINGLLDIEEINETDVIGKPSTTVECDKTLSNDDLVKAEFLSINENKLCIAYCHIPKEVNKSNRNEILTVYNSIIYNKTNIAESLTTKTYSDDWVTMKYNPNLFVTNKLSDTNSRYCLLLHKNSTDFNESNLYSNSIIFISAVPDTTGVGSLAKNNKALAVSAFNAVLSTDEITEADITENGCNKKLSDGRLIKCKFLDNINGKIAVAVSSIIADEDNQIVNELDNAFNSIKNN